MRQSPPIKGAWGACCRTGLLNRHECELQCGPWLLCESARDSKTCLLMAMPSVVLMTFLLAFVIVIVLIITVMAPANDDVWLSMDL